RIKERTPLLPPKLRLPYRELQALAVLRSNCRRALVREIRTPRSVGTGGGRPPPVTRWMWKRSHGRTSEAPPDERGGYRYVRPTATASHLDSTHPPPCRPSRRRSPHPADSGHSGLGTGTALHAPDLTLPARTSNGDWRGGGRPGMVADPRRLAVDCGTRHALGNRSAGGTS